MQPKILQIIKQTPPLRVDTYNYVPTSITGSFSFTGSLVVTSKSSCALTKGQKQKKILHVSRLP
jgi:hypothetical protein